MKETELTSVIVECLEKSVHAHLRAQPLEGLCDLDSIEALARRLAHVALVQVFAAWKDILREAALTVGRKCPRCEQDRKCKTRPGKPMRLRVLGFELEIPKLYLECGRCDAPGVSITRLLTGLSSGDSSGEMELMAAYCAAEHSYGKSSRDLEIHHGVTVERTAVRRLALAVEQQALVFAEQERHKALARVSEERRQVGVERLMLQGDGGTVRTGRLVPCERGDVGYGKKTAKTGRPKRKRITQNRELITLDVRAPGEMEATALDVVVPVVAAQNQRERRMLALAARKGLGDNTEVIGLGDLGSRLPQAFDEAFIDYTSWYSGDWKHTSDYVQNAAGVLEGVDASQWEKRMKDALWDRNAQRRDELLAQAREHRVAALPAESERCPVKALDTYVHNNWKYLQAARLKRMDLDFVSARAEAQVRDRTKSRFRVPGAWREENLEGKAILRAIIAEGSWAQFRSYYFAQRAEKSRTELYRRAAQAVAEGRLCSTAGLTACSPTNAKEENAMLHAA